MKSNDRQKMCTQCDGRIPIEALECPYCSAELTEAPQESSSSLFTSQSIETSLTSLYSPPYGSKPQAPNASTSYTDSFKKVPETFREVPSKSSPLAAPAINSQALEGEKPVSKNMFLPTLTLFCGSNFLVLGLLQCFFSENGKLTMEWDSSYWFVYCLASLPLFLYGYKKLSPAEEKN